VILYAHPSESVPPAWLRGADNLCQRKTREHLVYGIGIPACLSEPPPSAVDLEAGWKAWVNDDGLEPERLHRSLGWTRSVDAEDQDGRIWSVPMILSEDGRRAFQVSYDDNFQPVVAPGRQLLLDYAQEARNVLVGHFRAKTLSDLPMSACAKWAAAFLEAGSFVSVCCLGRLGILNDRLVLETLMAATSLDVGVADVGP